jgi:hypothetical protein
MHMRADGVTEKAQRAANRARMDERELIARGRIPTVAAKSAGAARVSTRPGFPGRVACGGMA